MLDFEQENKPDYILLMSFEGVLAVIIYTGYIFYGILSTLLLTTIPSLFPSGCFRYLIILLDASQHFLFVPWISNQGKTYTPNRELIYSFKISHCVCDWKNKSH